MSTLYHVTIPNMASTVRIVGRVSRDAESRFTPNGTQVTNVSMAVSRRYNQDGEWKETAQFVQIAVWGDAATRAQGIKKGDVVFVEFSMADMEARPYTTRDGEAKAALQVNRSQVARFAWADGSPAGVDGVPGLDEAVAVTPAEDEFPF